MVTHLKYFGTIVIHIIFAIPHWLELVTWPQATAEVLGSLVSVYLGRKKEPGMSEHYSFLLH